MGSPGSGREGSEAPARPWRRAQCSGDRTTTRVDARSPGWLGAAVAGPVSETDPLPVAASATEPDWGSCSLTHRSQRRPMSAETLTPLPRFQPEGVYRLYIGGRWVPTEATFEAVDPSLGEPWAAIGQATPQQVDDAVAAARAAFPAWSRSSLGTRQAILNAIADRVEASADRWTRLLPTENGRPVREVAIADVPSTSAIYRYFAGIVRDHH